MKDYTVHDIPGEEVINFKGGRWQYVRIVWQGGGTERYYHVGCDCITGDKGYCLICGATSPSATN